MPRLGLEEALLAPAKREPSSKLSGLTVLSTGAISPRGLRVRMRKLRSILVLFVALVLYISLASPAEDLPETAYDESEVLPYECTPLFSGVAMQQYARAPQSAPESSHTYLALLGSNFELCPSHRGQPHLLFDYLTILNHALRC